MAQWEFVEWLLFWILETSHFEFEWDDGNRSKNLNKHGIATEEIEDVFRSGLALPLGVQVAFVLREGHVRVISARPAHRKERAKYEEIISKISQRIR